MKIHGLQKMTLLDFPGQVACTVFLGGCDFRCPFCHNFELVDGSAQPVRDDTELLAFRDKPKGLLDGVAVTGGEPCLHPALPAVLRAIRKRGFKVKLDTNGYHPEMLRSLLEEGLVDYVAMDIKNSPAKYALTCGLTEAGGTMPAAAANTPAAGSMDLTPIRESIRLLMESGIDYEFRTAVVREFHTAEDFHGIGEMIAGAGRYFLQSFTDRDSVPFEGLHAPSPEELASFAAIMETYVPATQIRGVD